MYAILSSEARDDDVCVYWPGLSEEARADFRLMKDVAIYTRVSPESRMKSLGMFMDDLKKYVVDRVQLCEHSMGIYHSIRPHT